MPHLEALISKRLRKRSGGHNGEILIPNVYGRIKLDEHTRNVWIFTATGGEFTEYYRSLKGFYVPADIPTNFQERADITFEFKHPERLDDIFSN